MKKLTTLVLAAGLVVSSFAGSASAAEFKPFAQFAEEFTYGDAGTNSPENFNAATRVRFGFDYVASEDLSATILFQYLHKSWGDNHGIMTDPNVANNSDDHFRMRLAYIDWTIPATDVKVRMGRQAVVAPSYAFGSAILDGRADAVSFNAPVTENINLGFAWMRLDSDKGGKLYKKDKVAKDDTDALMLNAEFAFDGFKVAPWAMYISKQANSTLLGYPENLPEFSVPAMGYYPSADAYVLGASAELNMFDPFVFAVDGLYSKAQLNNIPANPWHDGEFDGYYVGAKASYKFSNGTAALGGWYASGTDYQNNDTGFVLLGGGFGASTILYGDNIIGADGYNTLTEDDSPFGTWGLVAEYAGFSFLENLSHTARVVYVEGTNENAPGIRSSSKLDFGKITEDDSLVEFDFNSTYQIYKNFAATLELGYVLVDQSNLAAGVEEQDDIFRSALTFVYKF